ncbi:RNA polymerase sigma-70 factor [Bacteroides fragilis]|uniref:RNA polymerase sigma-70 factor n=1 Tax=Bacteroides TaxID=816 RepID=UPI00228875B2|nr:RNA polymerase sigma-70 factor [Bacteroides sp.]MCY6333264.1 RNA polymerase sigma-70 factor [Bacteroides fragilis]
MKPNRTREEILLLSKLQQGDKKAFNTLFRKYYPTLCAYAHRFVDLEDAEEIVQDVMLWLWENREILLIESSLSQYLLKMIYHRALNRIAQKEVKYRADTLFYEKNQAMIYDVDFYQIEELTKRIHTAIAALPESYREAFIMHRFKDMSYKEIAELLNISTKTVDYRIQQALKLLRKELKEFLSLALIFLAA